MNERKRWAIVMLFGAAMAWMEAATVMYLRILVGRVDPYQAVPLPPHQALGNTELVREIATLLMLFAVGWLAGRNWRTRFCYSLIAFGVWDILYYVFLAVIVGWPKSVMDWDVLFLLPLPWWGPVIAPALIALMMIVGASLVVLSPQECWPRPTAVWLNLAGIFVALAVFMETAIRALPGGEIALRNALPTKFNWPWFAIACAMMASAIVDLMVQRRAHCSGRRA